MFLGGRERYLDFLFSPLPTVQISVSKPVQTNPRSQTHRLYLLYLIYTIPHISHNNSTTCLSPLRHLALKGGLPFPVSPATRRALLHRLGPLHLLARGRLKVPLPPLQPLAPRLSPPTLMPAAVLLSWAMRHPSLEPRPSPRLHRPCHPHPYLLVRRHLGN